jgi:hypothetical protein
VTDNAVTPPVENAPFRDDREAQLARAEALAVDNEQLKVENATLKEKTPEVRLRALALSLALELDGSLEVDSITTIEHLSSEACRDLANARTGMRDLREALREALHIAGARGRGEFPPEHGDRLAALETILAGWSE